MFNPANIPSWVSGGQTGDGSVHKYNRAVEYLKKKNVELAAQKQPTVEITEEAIKELYVKFGGLVLDVEDTEDEPIAEKKTKKAK